MKLVITEKPSVAQSIAKVIGANRKKEGCLEGSGYIVSWCVGHLVELSMPEAYDAKYKKWSYDDLPIIPEEWKYQISEPTKKQFKILKELMQRRDVESLVCATDAGREGELIFRLVYQEAGCKKPFERLWISSMEDKAIREGFENLKPGSDYDLIYEAALCREHADWLVGINGTRLFTCLYNQKLSVGRVMTPTLAMVVSRDAAISGFTPQTFYTPELDFGKFRMKGERIKQKEKAEKLVNSFRKAESAVVVKKEQKEKSEHAPLLYDLTSLQRDANKKLGFTAQQTLDYAQSLYEKKLLTYPRTDSRYLTDDTDVPGTAELVFDIQEKYGIYPDEPFDALIGQVMDSKKVSDHHALIPTETAIGYDVSALPSGEAAILKLVAVRLVCAVANPFRYRETTLKAECAGSIVSVKGKTVLDEGWKRYDICSGEDENKSDESNENDSIPDLAEGTEIKIVNAGLKEGKTTPPKRFSEDLLLRAMETASADEFPPEAERKGIGTSATRAATIEKLLKNGYLERKGNRKSKYLSATDRGTALVTVIPEQLQSPSMTADWEEKLLRIERGEYSPEEFMQEISDMVRDLVRTYEVVNGANVFMPSKGKVIGICPACGSEVRETSKGWFCANRECKFVLWKDNHYLKSIGKDMTESTAESLLKNGEAYLSGCRSKRTGKNFDATLVLKLAENGVPQFSLRFGNGDKK